MNGSLGTSWDADATAIAFLLINLDDFPFYLRHHSCHLSNSPFRFHFGSFFFSLSWTSSPTHSLAYSHHCTHDSKLLYTVNPHLGQSICMSMENISTSQQRPILFSLHFNSGKTQPYFFPSGQLQQERSPEDSLTNLVQGQILLDQSHLPEAALDEAKGKLEVTRNTLATIGATLGLIVLILALTLKPIWHRGRHESSETSLAHNDKTKE